MKKNELFEILEEKYVLYNTKDFILNDPIRVPHSFSRKEDIEIAAFFSSALAWGNRKAIIKAADDLMNRMDRAPADFVLNACEKDLNVFDRFVYRTFNAGDIRFFVRALKNLYQNHQGLERVFVRGYQRNQSVFESLCYFRRVLFSIDFPDHAGKHISDVNKGSAAKRLNLLLMWMVRRDKGGVHFGLWKGIDPASLMIPLDVHVQRTARLLGLLHRKQSNWKAVEELTGKLREFDPADPVKYDFALFGLSNVENIK